MALRNTSHLRLLRQLAPVILQLDFACQERSFEQFEDGAGSSIANGRTYRYVNVDATVSEIGLTCCSECHSTRCPQCRSMIIFKVLRESIKTSSADILSLRPKLIDGPLMRRQMIRRHRRRMQRCSSALRNGSRPCEENPAAPPESTRRNTDNAPTTPAIRMLRLVSGIPAFTSRTPKYLQAHG
ncbi:hypothetical protein P154DRAFT_537231 [Amniculicola lignicola CBS 123094]|uniref:Uncharacterized protein n=1 Tax=Amniculicola lignicola CBS 123094 TaxID=1392246 RepID=A0A6A5WB83_9PLEO|nr:hypothetical protein P154DRAFT_537231 [Amniculicola lignicola CBS 123094]